MTNCLLLSANRNIAECSFGNLYDPNDSCHPNNIIYVKNLLKCSENPVANYKHRF